MPSHAHVEGCARLNVMRLNAARLNYYEPILLASIGGVDRTRYVRIEGAAVTHVLNDAPDTANVRVHGFAPMAGQRFDLYLGDRSVSRQLFGGRILETTALYESRKENVAYDLQAIDPTWLLNRRRVLASYVAQSATTIARDLIARFTSGVTADHIADGLPVIDVITFTNETAAACLTALCERIGGYWYLDYSGGIHVFQQAGTDAHPITDADCRTSRDHQLSEDLSQVVTAVIARGGGGQASVDVPANATEIPIDDPAWYSDQGGLVEVAGARRLVYSGVRGRVAVGALVGTGNSPSSAPAPTPAAGSSHTVGATYQYAASYTTAAGETLPGPVGAITIKTINMIAPPNPLQARTRGPGSYPPGMISAAGSPIRFGVQIFYMGGAVGPLGGGSAPYTWDGYDWEVYLGPREPYLDGFYYPILEPGGPVAPVSSVTIYRSDNYQPYMPISSDYFGAGGGWYNHCCSGYGSPGTMPVSGFGSVMLKAIPISSASVVTGRKLYRTTANGAALKLLTTLANNSTTEYADTVADAALGAAPPTSDDSGITDNRQHPAGSTTLPVSDTAPFTADSAGAAGGWVRVAGMPIRYTGIGAGQLTGLPASGVGSLTATVRYGAQVLAQPRLRIAPSVPAPILAGDPVTIRYEVGDEHAQNALASRLGSLVIADGIVEEVYSDSRMTLAELQNYAAALLADRKDPRQTLRFVTRDDTVEVGRLITVTLTSPPISGTFRIQSIGFSEIAISGGLARVKPLRTVEASNKLYTFADLLRRLRGREGGAG